MRRTLGFIFAISFCFAYASSAWAGELEDKLFDAAFEQPVPAPPPITETQIRKILNILVLRGFEGSIKQETAEGLGLSKHGEKVHIRQLAIEDDSAVEYGFSLLKDGNGYMLDKGPRSGNFIAFYVDAELKIISAFAVNNAGERTPLSAADAEARLREVLASWAEYADTL